MINTFTHDVLYIYLRPLTGVITHMSNTQNPLTSFYRAPKLYVALPSSGKFYNEDIVVMSENNELAVFSMTAKDEMIMKNPDALLNGEAVAQVIASCVPQVKQPRAMVSNDIDTLLIAIQSATYGDDVDIETECPECQTPISGTTSIEDSLATMQILNESYTFDTDTGLTIEVKPFSYESSVQAGITNFQSTRSLQSLGDIDDELEQLHAFNQSFMRLAAMNFDLIVDSVASVKGTTPDGEDFIVSDKASIKEFMENCESAVGKMVEEKISEINTIGVNKKVMLQCDQEECGHQFEYEVGFDPVNFFTASSAEQNPKK